MAIWVIPVSVNLLLCWLFIMVLKIGVAGAALVSTLSRETTIITEGQIALRLLSLAYPLSGVGILVAAYFQSVGKAREALWLTLGGILVVKLPVLLLASGSSV